MCLPLLPHKMLWLEMYITSISIPRKLWFQTECWTGKGAESRMPFMWLPFVLHLLTATPPSFLGLYVLFIILQNYSFIIGNFTFTFGQDILSPLQEKENPIQAGLSSKETLLLWVTGMCSSRVGFECGVTEGATALRPQFLCSQLCIPVCLCSWLCLCVCQVVIFSPRFIF